MFEASWKEELANGLKHSNYKNEVDNGKLLFYDYYCTISWHNNKLFILRRFYTMILRVHF